VKGQRGPANASEYTTKLKNETFHSFGAHKIYRGFRGGREEKKRGTKARKGAPEKKTEGKKGFIGERKRRAWCMPAGEMPVLLNWSAASCAPTREEELFEFFGHDRELQLGFG
jgi:hypothetical protein